MSPQLVPIRPISVQEAPRLEAKSGRIGVAIPTPNINVKTKMYKMSIGFWDFKGTAICYDLLESVNSDFHLNALYPTSQNAAVNWYCRARNE